MIFFYFKIIKYLKHYGHSLSIISRRVQRDLNRTLLAEAIIPIFSAFLPMAVQIISGVADGDFVFANFMCGILYSWIPTGNALCVLFFITAYREKVKQLLCCIKPRSINLIWHSPNVGTSS